MGCEMTLKVLWIVVSTFSILEWVSIPFLLLFTNELYQVLDGIFIISFVVYPIFYVLCLLLLKKGMKKTGAVILLIPLVLYIPLLMSIQELVR